MHPPKIATDAEILSVADAFPEAMGIRVLKSAHVVDSKASFPYRGHDL